MKLRRCWSALITPFVARKLVALAIIRPVFGTNAVDNADEPIADSISAKVIIEGTKF